jgi:hypothetical protein
MFYWLLMGTIEMQTNQSVNSQNYITGKVMGEHIGSSEQCGNQPMEQIFVESTEKY